MFDNKKQKFLFKCEDCEMILSIELEDKEDLEKFHDDKFILECPCGGRSCPLRD